MNWIDITTLAIVMLSVIIGVFRGFVKEVLSLLNWGVAIFATVYFHEQAQNYLKPYIDSETILSIASFTVVFLLFIIVGSLITHLIGYLVRKSGIGGTDRMLGLLFGFARGMLVSAVLLAAVSFTPVKNQKSWQNSIVLPAFNPVIAWLNTNISSHLTDSFDGKNAIKDKMIKSASNIRTVQEIIGEEESELPS